MADEQQTDAPVRRIGSRKTQAGAPETGHGLRKAPGPRGCRRFARARLAEAMPALVGTLIEQSQGGSLGHMRLLVQLSGLDEAPAPRSKRGDSTVKALVDEWRERAVKLED